MTGINVRFLAPLGVAFVLCFGNARAQSPFRNMPGSRSTDSLSRELQQLRETLGEVRRDQLNYQIERDLLKEAYSSNLQTINLILTLILGAFSVLGFLGLRSLGSLRTEFQRDLDQFRGARTQLDLQLKQLEREQERASSQVSKLEAENEDQDRRLKTLEIREKISALIAQKSFEFALEYLAIGLEMSPDDPIMLGQRAHCLGKLGRITESIAVYEAVLRVKPDDPNAVPDLAEFYLLTNRIADYERLVGVGRDVIERRNPLLMWYMGALKLLMVGDSKGLIGQIRTLLTLVPREKSDKMPNWSFAEVRKFLAGRTDLPSKALFLSALDFVQGRTDAAALDEILVGLKA